MGFDFGFVFYCEVCFGFYFYILASRQFVHIAFVQQRSRIGSDAMDNCANVECSAFEVNIKSWAEVITDD
jgi:hypothetical protein